MICSARTGWTGNLGAGGGGGSSAIASVDGVLYFTLDGTRLFEFDPGSGAVTPVAGRAARGMWTAPGTDARLGDVSAIAADGTTLYLTDTDEEGGETTQRHVPNGCCLLTAACSPDL